MKLNSISGITCYVEDLAKTADFYEAIGFRAGKQEEDRLTFYVNWFFVTFIAQDREEDAEMRTEAELPNKGSGLSTYVKVDDLDAYYNALVSKGLKPASDPQVRHGNREFALRDPDGYKLVFFEKK
jgi:catechol 2,3-dioxygenase-like lactoylglutathione lyase family enzyme